MNTSWEKQIHNSIKWYENLDLPFYSQEQIHSVERLSANN